MIIGVGTQVSLPLTDFKHLIYPNDRRLNSGKKERSVFRRGPVKIPPKIRRHSLPATRTPIRVFQVFLFGDGLPSLSSTTVLYSGLTYGVSV